MRGGACERDCRLQQVSETSVLPVTGSICTFYFWKFSKGRTMFSTGIQFSAGPHFWSAQYHRESARFRFLKANLSGVSGLSLDPGYKINFTSPLQHTFQVTSENTYCMILYCNCLVTSYKKPQVNQEQDLDTACCNIAFTQKQWNHLNSATTFF